VRPDGSEDISRFTVKHGYIVTAFYKYLDTTTPSRENLLKLAKDLECDPWWLLFGEDAVKPRRPSPARGRQARENLLPAEASSALKKKRTIHSLSARKDDGPGTLRKVRGRTTSARRLLSRVPTAASGSRRRVA